MKRFFVSLIVLALVGSLAFATGAQEKKTTEYTGELDVFLGADIAPESVIEAVKMFQAEYTGVKVNLETASYTDFNARLLPRIDAGNMPDVVSSGQSDFIVNAVEKGFYRDLGHTNAFKQMVPAAREKFTSPSGVKFCVSQGQNTVFCYYNIAYFKKAGITKNPENFEELLEACEKLKAAGYVPIGIAGAGANNLTHSFLSQGMLYEIVGSGYDPKFDTKNFKGPYDYDTPEWNRVLAKAAILRDRKYFQPGFESADYPTTLKTISTGQVAMVFQQNIMFGNIYTDAKKNGFEIGIMHMPWNDKGKPQGNQTTFEMGTGLGKNKNGREKLADLFLDWYAYDHYYLFQNQSGSVPPFTVYPPNCRVDPSVAERMAYTNGLKFSCNYAVYAFPGPVVTETRNFITQLVLGKVQPGEFGAFINKAQKEYADNLK